ncbi:uncharacterized protein [Typha angustifolia]|uniref:uncharacterized protein n=1 Tax=Typha angustifolia TaxID=59011 RepID=UPI003C2B40BB
METKCGMVIIDSLADSIPAKTSCLEKIEVEEAHENGVLEGTEVKVEKVETGINFVSSKTHCLKNASDVEELDSTICKHDCGIDIAPTTPSSDREMLVFLSASEICGEDLESGCQTPRDSIFDPFAPGPEELLFAPKKMVKIRDGLFSRQLNFDLRDPGDFCFQVAS